MSFELPGAGVPVDELCRYGNSKLVCRGPRKPLDAPFVAFLGGNETYGKFVQRPFPSYVEETLGLACVNLGCADAGLDTFAHDHEIVSVAGRAHLAVIQVMGAQNLSNRYYRVHPRRNDRFLQATPLLARAFRGIDFTEFNFNKHLLGALCRASPSRFEAVRDELRRVWAERMRRLIKAVGHRPLLLWLRYRDTLPGPLGADPLLVTRSMLDDLGPVVRGVIEIPVTPVGNSEEIRQMRFGPMQAPAAMHMVGPLTHLEIAARLSDEIAAVPKT